MSQLQRLPDDNELERPNSPLALPPEDDDDGREKTTRFFLPTFEWAASHTEFAAIFIAIFVVMCFLPHLYSFQERDDIERKVATWLPGRAMLEAFEYRLYDQRFTQRGPLVPTSRDKIAIVAVDQNSLGVVGQWPWPRSLHARLIRRLDKAGAKVIALDFDFSDRQFPDEKGRLSKEDLALIKAAGEAKNVILPSLFDASITQKQGETQQAFQYHVASPFTEQNNQPGLDEQTLDLALAYLPVDSDGGYRRYPFKGQISGATVGSFAVLAAGMYQNLVTYEDAEVYEASLKTEFWPTLGEKSHKVAVPLRHAALSGPDAPQFWNTPLNFWGPPGVFPTYAYSDVVSPQNYSDAKLKELFQNKIVFVGATALILKDLFPLPEFSVASGATKFALIPGVEIHATATAMLLDGAYIQPPSSVTTFWNLLGLTIFSCAWTAVMRERVSRVARVLQERWHKRKRLRRYRIRIHDSAWFVLYGVVALLPPIAFWGVCSWLFTHQSRWIVAAYPLTSSVVAAAIVLVFLFTVESAERRKTLHQVGLYMDKDILEEILAHKEEEHARPRRTVATVMFTDLEGFTTYSETHEAEEVVAALNAYMTMMRPVVKRYGGVVDKYIGDAIMAYFGVPLSLYDHAERALACAIEMQEVNAQFREKTGIAFYTRIGIHTGELIAGGIGSEGDENNDPQFGYTVIGDTVNLASRLEGKNKEFGSWIMCSSATFEAAPHVAEVEPAKASIKGKSAEVEVFIVRGFLGEPRDDFWGKRLKTSEAETLPEAPQSDMPEILALPAHHDS